MENNIAAIVLAGGLSRRMGVFKPLLPLAGIPAMTRVLREIGEAGFSRIVVVTGYQSEKLKPLILSQGAFPCYNERYEEGMYSSLLAGVRCSFRTGEESGENRFKSAQPQGFIMVPADCALITKDVYETIKKAAAFEPEKFAVACYKGKNGHPLYVPAKYVQEILLYSGEKGMKFFTEKYREEIRKIEVDSPEIHYDMDDLEGYQRMQFFLEEKRTGLPVSCRKIYLIRHGETQQHSEPIMLGQTDVPLSEKGLRQAIAAGEKLYEFSPALSGIYASDLIRAAETAKTIAESNHNHPKVFFDSRLREISLGIWDGRAISDLRNRYPREFEERGKDILRFRIPDGETFDELAKRSLDAFLEIMKNTDGEIALVTHAGVIRAIIAHLCGIPVEELLPVRFENGCVLPLLYRENHAAVII